MLIKSSMIQERVYSTSSQSAWITVKFYFETFFFNLFLFSQKVAYLSAVLRVNLALLILISDIDQCTKRKAIRVSLSFFILRARVAFIFVLTMVVVASGDEQGFGEGKPSRVAEAETASGATARRLTVVEEIAHIALIGQTSEHVDVLGEDDAESVATTDDDNDDPFDESNDEEWNFFLMRAKRTRRRLLIWMQHWRG